MDAAGLIAEAVRLIKTFNPAVSTMDSHVLDTLGSLTDVGTRTAPFLGMRWSHCPLQIPPHPLSDFFPLGPLATFRHDVASSTPMHVAHVCMGHMGVHGGAVAGGDPQ